MLSKIEKAFLDTIAYAEGSLGVSNNGYDNVISLDGKIPRVIVGWTDNTNIIHGGKDWYSSKLNSTASGRYQFTINTWLEINNKINKPMTSTNQDYACIKLINSRKVKNITLDEIVVEEKFNLVVESLKPTWAGFKTKSLKDLYQVFNLALSKY
jgi:hypothetical protein